MLSFDNGMVGWHHHSEINAADFIICYSIFDLFSVIDFIMIDTCL